MDGFAVKGVEICRQGGNLGFAFAGFHLGDTPLVKHDTADKLNPVVPGTQHPVGGFPHQSKGIRQDILLCFAVCQPLPEHGGLSLKFFIAHGFIFVPEGLYFINKGN